MNKVKPFIFFLLLLTYFSCSTIEDPSIKGIEDVDILQANKDRIELNAVLIIDNPNPFALDLDKADLKVLVDEVEVATIQQTYESKMPANKEFKMPIYLNMDIKKIHGGNKLAALGKGLQLIADRQIEVSLKGNIKVGKGAAKLKTPVDRKELVKF